MWHEVQNNCSSKGATNFNFDEHNHVTPTVTEPTNYTKLSKKIIYRADDLANLSPYNPVVREITTDFKPTLHISQDRNKFSGHHHKLHKSSRRKYIGV
jgi:hypothetical protein